MPSYQFTTTRTEIERNIDRFNLDLSNRTKLPANQDHDMQTMIARTELWAACKDSKGQWLVGPSKFITVKNITPQIYSQIRKELHSGNAANHLRKYLSPTPLKTDHPAWREVENLARLHSSSGRPKVNALAYALIDGEDEAGDTPAFTEAEQKQMELASLLLRQMTDEMRREVLNEFQPM